MPDLHDQLNSAPGPTDISPSEDETQGPVIVIESRAFFRDCISQCLRSTSGVTVRSFANVADWLELSKSIKASLIVLCKSGRLNDEETKREISALVLAKHPAPAIVLADVEDTEKIVGALENGACGYIPTTLSLDVALGAMRLVKAGGTFVPAASLLSAHRIATAIEQDRRPSPSMFTARQIAVVEALRRGKANKLIAYELNMCESTVKVHVRNIMKKLKAKNRTQVAFMANELLRNEAS